MSITISIIGLGQIGASIGLALASNKDQVTTIGYDKSNDVMRQAEKKQVVDSFAANPGQAIKKAEVIILALPLDEMEETLRSIGAKDYEGALVIDTAPAKQIVAGWVEKYLPAGYQHLSLTPAINPFLLDEIHSGIEAARADMFKDGLMAITTGHGTSEGTLKFITSFVHLLGARALFFDPVEVDGIMACIHTLPALATFSLIETAIDQPGWGDIRKLAGKPFAATRHLLLGEDRAIIEATHGDRENTLRVLDDYIHVLSQLREEISEDKKEDMQNHIERVLKSHTQWRQERSRGDWDTVESIEQQIPTFSELWAQQLGLGKLIGLRRKQKDDKK
jgi:prephenate dehydrogenase